MVLFSYDGDLKFVEELGQISASLLLLDVESANVNLGTCVHLDHFVLSTELSLSSVFNLVISRPGLLSCECTWVVLDSIIVSRVISLGTSCVSFLDALNLST